MGQLDRLALAFTKREALGLSINLSKAVFARLLSESWDAALSRPWGKGSKWDLLLIYQAPTVCWAGNRE